MGAMRDLKTGLATMAANAGLGVYRSDGSNYLAGETAIVMNIMPVSPDRCAVINAVPLTDVVNVPQGLVMVQFAFRGAPNNNLDVDDLADSFFSLFHGSVSLVLGSVTVEQMNRNNVIPMGQDQSTRIERVDKYYLDCGFPATTSRPS